MAGELAASGLRRGEFNPQPFPHAVVYRDQIDRARVVPMNNAPEHPNQAPSQPREEPRYEKPAVKKIGNMSANTKIKSDILPK
jgi:hypothetical protein